MRPVSIYGIIPISVCVSWGHWLTLQFNFKYSAGEDPLKAAIKCLVVELSMCILTASQMSKPALSDSQKNLDLCHHQVQVAMLSIPKSGDDFMLPLGWDGVGGWLVSRTK